MKSEKFSSRVIKFLYFVADNDACEINLNQERSVTVVTASKRIVPGNFWWFRGSLCSFAFPGCPAYPRLTHRKGIPLPDQSSI